MKSIRLKIWLSIVGLTVLVSGAVWQLQMAFLESSYLANKEQEILMHTKQISDILTRDGIQIDGNNLLEFSRNYNYSIIMFEETTPIFLNQPPSMFDIIDNQIWERLKEIPKNYVASNDDSYGEVSLHAMVLSSGNSLYIGVGMQMVEGVRIFTVVASTLAPVKEALLSVQQEQLRLTSILIAIASLVAFFISHSLTKPIQKLTVATREVAKGNFGIVVEVKSKDELGRLAATFNQMSKEMASVNKLQRELISNLSHDIRTPLTMMRGYAEMIRDLTGDDKQKRNHQLSVIIDETERLNYLVNDILELSKYQSGQLKLDCAQFNLSHMLEDMMKRYDLLITNEGFDFTVQCPTEVPVYADPHKFEQVLYNLINNATNHTGADKKVCITVSQNHFDILVQITDTGAGIPHEHLPFIWERYYKPYKQDDRKGMGTGLGLSIVKEILQAHGFPFGVDSIKNQGTTFWVRIPRS